MKMGDKRAVLTGIIPPLVTPLLDSATVDERGLERLTERVAAGGVDGVFLLGTTGEAPSLKMKLKTRFTRLACALMAGRLPAVVNVTATAVDEVFELAECAAECGANALALGPPFYFQLTQDELAGYFERVIPRLPLPVYLYNYPQLFKTPIEPQTVARARQLPQVVGLKDSSGDMAYFGALRKSFAAGSGFGLYCGPEELLDQALALGADGAVAGGANLFPTLYADLFAAHRRGDENAVKELQAMVMEVSRGIYAVAGGSAGTVRGIKCALMELGVANDYTAEPFDVVPSEIRERIAKVAALLDERFMERVR